MKFGIKQKILLVLIGLLALTSGLDALLASYFTNRQNERTAYADLERDLLAWHEDLSAATLQLRQVALDTAGDVVVLDQLRELITLELNLDPLSRSQPTSDTARTVSYMKSVSLNRLQLVLRSGGFTGIGVYTGGRLSHFVSASRAGMAMYKPTRGSVWVEAPADAHGHVPLENWPAWAVTKRPFEWAFSADELKEPAISFHWVPQGTMIRIAVPIQGIVADMATDVVAHPTTRFVSELTVAGARSSSGAANAPSNRQAAPVALIAFVKVVDRAALEQVAAKTGKQPAVLSLDGKYRQQLTDESPPPPDLLQDARTAAAATSRQVAHRTVTNGNGSYYQSLLPWWFEGQPRLILGLTASRASTQQNIRQTVAAILTVAGLVLLSGILLGTFWVSRFIDPIVALTGTAKKIGTQRLTQAERDDALADGPTGDRDSVEKLHRIAVEAPNEVGDLAQAFEAMIGELGQSFEVLEQRVQDRTAELRQQTRYLRTLIDMLPLHAWLKDTRSRYLAANQATAESSGRKVEELVGKSDLDLWPRELAESYRADDVEVMTTRQRKTVEERLADVKGTVWIETYKAPVVDEDGTILGTVGAARNISERKAAEAAREAALAEAERLARLRTNFLAQMSHELRTPLNAILGYAQILQREQSLSARQARGLAIILESGHHLLTLIDDILDLSRIGASKLELYPADTDLPAFLRVVADIIRVKADEKNLLFSYEASADLPAAVQMDDKRVRQVLLNLLGNAVKFTDQGRVALRVQRLAGTQSSARLRFEVEDTGVGMTSEQLSRIFSPFEQVGDPQRRHGGTGLGLAISQKLVELMGADIQVQSEPGKGSLFSFEVDLPLAESHVDLLTMHELAIGYRPPRRKILVVDDVPQSRSMLMDLLTTLGFDLNEAANGEEAIEKAQHATPDLIIMDITMPLMDGLEATRNVRAMAAISHVPIVITSASATLEDEARSLSAGANAFVRKPIDQRSLLNVIERLLAIEWTHERAVSEPGSAYISAEIDDESPIPPLKEMTLLHELSLAGNMRDICNRADHIESLDPRYRPFARRLRGLAEKYQSQAVRALVERALRLSR